MSYDFDKASKLLALYVSINKDGLSQLLPIANAAMDELKQMMMDEDNAATFTDPNPGVDDDIEDHDGDGLVTKNDQNIQQGKLDLSGKPEDQDGPTQPGTKQPIGTPENDIKRVNTNPATAPVRKV